ncbi:RpiB/LacA/LacB family sugar-phosphate isomerase [Pasteuria penetrans]|uniref:RpiB/LacA/LacB family sugar-phosphate isomerase n=1 Tax=Pasteuria penetrans TaxID=86005 RepID=UPI000FA7D482|nr:RpiB/LacA/LacB family sugar-phosphate isomerase [Pasteuria penetrans]
MSQQVVLGSDHAGIGLRTYLGQQIQKNFPNKYRVEVIGPQEGQTVDYPDIALIVGQKVACAGSCGVLICGTGVGISIAANKIPGIRCALVSDSSTARLSREHNDANIVALGARILGYGLAWDITVTWLRTPFSEGDRHRQRLASIQHMESGICGSVLTPPGHSR